MGLLCSFVADAGQDPTIGATRVVLNEIAPGFPAVLIPALETSARTFVVQPSEAVVREARLLVGTQSDLDAAPDEVDPKPTPKAGHMAAPTVDRTTKGDPSIGLRPTFDAKLRRRGALSDFFRSAVAFDDSDYGAPPRELSPPSLSVPGPESVGHFEAVADGEAATTHPSSALASPHSGLAETTARSQREGATPGVARAVVLASSTPAAAGSTPIQIAPLPKYARGPGGAVANGTTIVMGAVDSVPSYAGLVDGPNAASEQRCLVEAVYFEARSEPEEGQAAVAQVVLNRVTSGLYPPSICGVVFQNQQHHNACQFSFACEGHALRVTEGEAWGRASRVAREVLEGAAYVSDVGEATHYHANYVRPGWARRLVKMDKIGRHIFYRLKDGQT